MAYPWSAHDILTAADLNAAIATGIVSTGLGAWTSYTPVWTSSGTAVALGNGTVSGKYCKTGRRVEFIANINMGSTTTYGTGNYFISLPEAASASMTAMPLGPLGCLDNSAGARFFRTGWLWTATTAIFMAEAGTLVTSLSPMTWAVSDAMYFHGSYESAT